MSGLRIGANWWGNPICRTAWNVKTNFVDFVDENANVDDDDYDFVFMDNKDQFGKNQS
jgi:hypothetical protein